MGVVKFKLEKCVDFEDSCVDFCGRILLYVRVPWL